MTTLTRTSRAIAACAFATGTLLTVPSAADAAQPCAAIVAFVKQDPDGDFVFEGTTRGAVRGTLTSYPTSVAGNGPVLDVTFVWEVAAGRRSFTAVTSGTLDTVSGEVVMSGEVTDGWRRGCRVKEKGQLTDPSVSEYRGVIRILPARR